MEFTRALDTDERPLYRSSKHSQIHQELKALRQFVGTDHEERNASMEFVKNSHKDCDTPKGEIEGLCVHAPDLDHFRIS